MKLKALLAAMLVSANLALAQPLPQTPPTLNAVAPRSVPDREGNISLDSANWQLQSIVAVTQSGEEISQPSFPLANWHQARVPGTVLANYVRDGLVPDPDFGDQVRLISEDQFNNDFWYRRQFIAPEVAANQHLFLYVNGINWKADIFLNGAAVGHLDGAFARGQFDITAKILPGRTNAVAFLIHTVAHPGAPDFMEIQQKMVRVGKQFLWRADSEDSQGAAANAVQADTR